jgi:hypothetical protein
MKQAEIKAMADKVVAYERPEDCDIPNLAGIQARAMLKHRGWYTLTFDGVRLYLELKGRKTEG